MSDKRKHRGANPQDLVLFRAENLPILRQAADDYALLLTKNYPQHASLKLVGDKFELTDRQRLALMRSCCSEQQAKARLKKKIQPNEICGRKILIDGYNVLISVEAAMSGAFIFIGKDGCFRDLAGLHGTYKKVTETVPALKLINNCVRILKASDVVWFLDKPVSNSGRLKKIIEQETSAQVILLDSPDTELKKSSEVVASSDSIILDACKQWFNLTGLVIAENKICAKIVAF